MSETIPGGPEKERVPSEREVMNQIEKFIGNKPFTEIRRNKDEAGVYRLIIEVIGDDGDPVRYDYVRAGDFPEGNISETAIDAIYFDADGNEVGGEAKAKFVEGKWVEEN